MITVIIPECLWSVSSHLLSDTLYSLVYVAVQCPGNNKSLKLVFIMSYTDGQELEQARS